MSKKRPTKRIRKIAIDPHPKGNLKALAGGELAHIGHRRGALLPTITPM